MSKKAKVRGWVTVILTHWLASRLFPDGYEYLMDYAGVELASIVIRKKVTHE